MSNDMGSECVIDVQRDPYGGGAISFHDDVCVLSFGWRSRMYFDSVIFSSATSLHLRKIWRCMDEVVMLLSG